MPKESLLRRFVWAGLACMALTNFIFLQILGVQILYRDALSLLIVLLGYFLLSFGFYKVPYNNLDNPGPFGKICKIFAYFLETFGQCFLFIILSAVLTYIAAASPEPFYDKEIFAVDQWLGFDLRFFLDWVNRHAYANIILENSYNSFFQIPLLFLCLAVYQKHSRAYSVMLCFIIAFIISVIIMAAFPTIAPHTFLKIDAGDYPNVNMISGHWHVDDFFGMRDGTLKTLNLFTLKGLITFPSYHASIAIILLWGFWSISWLKIPALLLNSLVLLSVPITGGHYFADVIAGVIISVIAILLVKKTNKYADTKLKINT